MRAIRQSIALYVIIASTAIINEEDFTRVYDYVDLNFPIPILLLIMDIQFHTIILNDIIVQVYNIPVILALYFKAMEQQYEDNKQGAIKHYIHVRLLVLQKYCTPDICVNQY